MSPAAPGGWIANFVDRGQAQPFGRHVDLTMESLTSGFRDPAGLGRRMTAGRSGSTKQRRGIRRGVL